MQNNYEDSEILEKLVKKEGVDTLLLAPELSEIGSLLGQNIKNIDDLFSDIELLAVRNVVGSKDQRDVARELLKSVIPCPFVGVYEDVIYLGFYDTKVLLRLGDVQELLQKYEICPDF